MFRTPFLTFVALLFSLAVFAQTKNTKNADTEFANEKYSAAIESYKKCYSTEGSVVEKARIIFQIAECYRLMADLESAKSWYEKSIRAKHQDPKQYLYLAECYKQEGKFKEAIEKYTEFKRTAKDPAADQGIKACKLALEWTAKPTRFVVQAEEVLNSPAMDFAPAILDKKDNMIVFASSREGSSGNKIDERSGENFSDLYFSNKDKKGKWGEPVLLDPAINTEANEGAAKLNPKRSVMYFTRCEYEKKKSLGCDIYKANYSGGKFGEITKLADLKAEGEEAITVAHPTVNKTESTLVFAADYPGGQGGKDLWMITYDKKAKTWSKPQNLGPKINTDGDEMYPFIAESGELYFSSTGHIGMGGMDIFKANALDENKWGEVENMKVPVNSPKDDYGIYFTDPDKGFFSSNRVGGRGKDDIYSFFYPPIQLVLKGTVYDKDNKKGVAGATVRVTGNDGTPFEKTTDAEGAYDFTDNNGQRFIQPEKIYAIEVLKKDYLVAKDKIATTGLNESTTFVQDFVIQYTPANKAIRMPEVQYELGKYNLLENSKDSLNFLLKILQDNPTIVVELQAHTDSRGDDAANLDLSQKRAQACVDYLISKGIPKERMVAKGYGETQLKITDEQIKTAGSKSEQEALHQLNRRTEFSVLNSNYVPGGAAAQTPAPAKQN
ncbi:MAG TPA: OmpA family protein [Luteibaculaceae bacterium]|nr:OmpA family protein [Luteibaculaceae bacterium]